MMNVRKRSNTAGLTLKFEEKKIDFYAPIPL